MQQVRQLKFFKTKYFRSTAIIFFRILCEFNHQCKSLCGEKCGPCKTIVKRTLSCNHIVNMKCYIKPEDYKCFVPMKRTLPCEHEVDVPCHMDPKTYRCPISCDSRVEPCGHACTLSCHKFNDPDHLKVTLLYHAIINVNDFFERS